MIADHLSLLPDDPACYSGKITLATPSVEQCNFFTFLVRDSRSAILSAVAGSGKTTTIVEGCKLVPLGVSARFLAFNKSIADTLATRLPSTISSSTFHSCGYEALRRHLPKSPKVDRDKVREILKKNLKRTDFETYFKFVTRLVSYAKSVGIGTALLDDNTNNWFHLISHFNLYLDGDGDESEGVRLAREVLATSNALLSSIDFDDMLYLAILRKVNFDKSNFVFVDEAQDLNAIRREVVKRLLPNPTLTTSRLIAVGDPHQAIYGFTGADNDSLDILQREHNAVRLPLSVSYRCSQAVVREAQKVLNGTW